MKGCKALKTLFMFPGQGAQTVGMARELLESDPDAPGMFEKASDILGYDLSAICLNGPEDKLNSTEYAQPAIFVHSAAALNAIRAGRIAPELQGVQPDGCAGLSLGEYTALYAAGVLSFEDGVRLVQLRGQSMQQAANLRQGTMVSIMGCENEAVEKLCETILSEGIKEEDGLETILSPVNYNCPGQLVVSGSLKACERIAVLAPEAGASRALPLKVAGAFHTMMMAPAAEKLEKALQSVQFGDLQVSVIANVDAQPYRNKEEISGKLLKQLVSAVRWQQSVEYLLRNDYGRYVEIGPGRVLTGLLKKISRPFKKEITIINAG